APEEHVLREQFLRLGFVEPLARLRVAAVVVIVIAEGQRGAFAEFLRAMEFREMREALVGDAGIIAALSFLLGLFFGGAREARQFASFDGETRACSGRFGGRFGVRRYCGLWLWRGGRGPRGRGRCLRRLRGGGVECKYACKCAQRGGIRANCSK